MIRTHDTLDPQTKHEVLATAMILHAAFEEAARQVNDRFGDLNLDQATLQELVREAGMEIIAGTAIALEYEHTENIPEGQVSEMLKAACY